MATVKNFTSLEQSRKLAKILPLESADMCYSNDGTAIKIDANPYTVRYSMWKDCVVEIIPCWSLASLLSVLPKEVEIDGQRYAPCLFPVQDKWLLKLWYNSNYTITSPIAIFSNNPVDACVAMIERLHKLNLL